MSNITLPDLQSLEEGVFLLFQLKILIFLHFILFRPGFRRRDIPRTMPRDYFC
jgi:hypothetical protein